MTIQFYNNLMVLPGQYYTTVSGNNNDISVNSSALVVTTTNNNDALTGIVPIESAIDGGLIYIINDSATNNLIIPHDSSASTAGFRFILPPGFTTLTLGPREVALMFYVEGAGSLPYKEGTFS